MAGLLTADERAASRRPSRHPRQTTRLATSALEIFLRFAISAAVFSSGVGSADGTPVGSGVGEDRRATFVAPRRPSKESSGAADARVLAVCLRSVGSAGPLECMVVYGFRRGTCGGVGGGVHRVHADQLRVFDQWMRQREGEGVASGGGSRYRPLASAARAEPCVV